MRDESHRREIFTSALSSAHGSPCLSSLSAFSFAFHRPLPFLCRPVSMAWVRQAARPQVGHFFPFKVFFQSLTESKAAQATIVLAPCVLLPAFKWTLRGFKCTVEASAAQQSLCPARHSTPMASSLASVVPFHRIIHDADDDMSIHFCSSCDSSIITRVPEHHDDRTLSSSLSSLTQFVASCTIVTTEAFAIQRFKHIESLSTLRY